MVATAQGIRGFVGARSLDGGGPVLVTKGVTASAGTQYFIGDAVTLKTTGLVDTVSAASVNIFGVIQGIFKSNAAGQPAPLTFNLPGQGGLFLASNQAGFVSVITNPQQTFLVTIDVTASAGLIGSNFFVSAGTPVTAAGRSGQSLAKAISLSADGHFMCVGLAPTDLINGYASEYGDSNGKGVIEVKINNAAFGSNKIGI